MSQLETARLQLRPFALADQGDHRQLYSDPEVTKFLAGGPFLGAAIAERSARALARFEHVWAERGFGVWAVVDRATGRLLGQCGLNVLPDGAEVELLYALERASWGRGLATEAALAALRYGFEQTGLERIVAVTRPEHAASRRVMEKLGMAYEREVEVYGFRAVLYAISREAFGAP
ncbi:MAG: GNAT family N-acetyltransferase [Candidatus Rokubacteria bacterium]|nr:GNAT family N-acetyltransferase [Candidatus Rokubacteria bacterium]